MHAAGFSNFTSLSAIYLQGNQLSGPLPGLSGPIHGSIKELHVAYNNFSGAIPAAWAGLASTSMSCVNLKFNRYLCGAMPDGLPCLTSDEAWPLDVATSVGA